MTDVFAQRCALVVVHATIGLDTVTTSVDIKARGCEQLAYTVVTLSVVVTAQYIYRSARLPRRQN